MTFLQAVLIVVVPFIPLLLPGIFFIRMRAWNNTLIDGARMMLWSMGILTLLVTAGLYFGISVQISAMCVAIVGAPYALWHRKLFFTRRHTWHIFAILIPLLLCTALFIIPFLSIHDGLPTGDVQKTIIWANEIITTHSLPNYQAAISLLNRDPVDFYTPGLHGASALVMALSPSPLVSIGIFSIIIAVCVAFIAASMAKEVFDEHAHIVPPFLAALFVLTQFRFLRYLREPGYHFQNVVGELFLFGMILLCIRFIRRKEKQDAALFVVCGGALFLSHQFSAFIGVFCIAAIVVSIIVVFRNTIIATLKKYKNHSTILLVLLAGAISILFVLNLSDKIPALFTTTPHLTSLLLPVSQYPSTMGEFWFYSGVAGILLMALEARKRNTHFRQVVALLSVTIVLFALSQGPAIGIDIPPVRALFYLVVPFSIGAAYLFGKLFYTIRYTYSGNGRKIAYITTALAIIIAVSASTNKAYSTLSHTVRTNSTLSGEQLGLIEQLRSADTHTEGILIDDYSRKAASWLVLSGKPMFTRIGADLERQMEESIQSQLRKELYLHQLDYEKIVELGSLPEITSLFAKNNIKFVTGITGASYNAFANNPALQEVATADDITLFEIQQTNNRCGDVCEFLLSPSTLANDIGDDLDTYEYLQASIRSTRVSDPQVRGNTTYREVSAPIIPLSFNVGDYVRVLWDANNIGKIEHSLTFMLDLITPVQGLTLNMSSGKRIALPYQKHIVVEIPRELVEINDKGFIVLSLDNPSEANIPIDLIALGL
ncbi:MAG: hypothetical protein AAB649_03300 [Patescibacteria group bacterium]